MLNGLAVLRNDSSSLSRASYTAFLQDPQSISFLKTSAATFGGGLAGSAGFSSWIPLRLFKIPIGNVWLRFGGFLKRLKL
jgi:hypothetical protein